MKESKACKRGASRLGEAWPRPRLGRKTYWHKDKARLTGTRNYWGGPPLGVQNLYTFPFPKTGIKQIEQFNMSSGLRKKAQDVQGAVLRFLKFSVSVALTRRLRFLKFSVYYAIYKINRGFEIFEVFSFNRTDKAFEIFCPMGTRDTIILLEGVPSRWPPRVRPSSPESS